MNRNKRYPLSKIWNEPPWICRRLHFLRGWIIPRRFGNGQRLVIEHRRLLAPIDNVPPAEYEKMYHNGFNRPYKAA